MERLRQHPVNILQHIGRNLYLLLIPVIRGILYLNFDFYAWLKGAWLDILVVMFLLGIALYKWYSFTFILQRDGLLIEKGIFIKLRTYIPYQAFSLMNFEQPFYFLPFRAVKAFGVTDAFSFSKSDFTATVSISTAKRLRDKTSRHEDHTQPRYRRIYKPSHFHIALLSIFTSNSLTGIIFAATFIIQSGTIIGNQIKDLLLNTISEVANYLSLGLHPAAVFLSLILIGGYVLSVIRNLLRYIRFKISREENELTIFSGAVTQYNYTMPVRKINYIDIKQTLLTKFFGICSVFVHLIGYNKNKRELSVLIPPANKREALGTLRILLPEFQQGQVQTHPHIRTLSRFLIPPVSVVLCIPAVAFVLWLLFPDWLDLILFVAIMGELPALWWIAVKITAYFTNGLGISGDTLTLQYAFAFNFHTVIVPADRIVYVNLRQSIYQKMSSCCDIVVYTNSDFVRKHTIQNLPVEKAREILRNTYHNI